MLINNAFANRKCDAFTHLTSLAFSNAFKNTILSKPHLRTFSQVALSVEGIHRQQMFSIHMRQMASCEHDYLLVLLR